MSSAEYYFESGYSDAQDEAMRERLDEENRLKPDFIDAVQDALEAAGLPITRFYWSLAHRLIHKRSFGGEDRVERQSGPIELLEVPRRPLHDLPACPPRERLSDDLKGCVLGCNGQ